MAILANYPALPIADVAARFPDQLAFVDAHHQLRYGEIAEAIAKSPILQADDLQAGDHVAWCPANDLDAFVSFWALLAKGCVACPVSHRYPPKKLAEILVEMDARWFDGASVNPAANHCPQQRIRATELSSPPATLILTSGSTGMPKSVVHSVAAHVASATGAAVNIPLSPGDRWLWSLPLCHVSGMSILFRCATAAATVVGVPTGASPTAQRLEQQRITHLSAVSVQLQRLMADDSFPTSHLRFILLGGGSVDETLVAATRARGISLSTTYGLTEMASQVTTSDTDGAPFASGRVLPGRNVRIDDSGEIQVKGDSLFLGYYRNDAITPSVDEQGWFHTGDLGEWSDDQELIVHGRIDNMFVSGGENIHPESIESAMMKHLSIQQVIVVPQFCKTYGQRPVAFVQGELPDDWQNTLRKHLRGYEIPVEIRPWPAAAEGAIKANRAQLK
ncbi:MAG: AMP-binding protein, partial [Planctomycetota bacterium]